MITRLVFFHLSVCSKMMSIGLCLLLLTSCVSPPSNIPISSRTRPATVTWGTHTVQRGETLYTIAWRYGQEFKRLAAINGIRAPYTIYPGQKLRLGGQARTQTVARKPSPKKTVAASSQARSTGVESASNKKRSISTKGAQSVSGGKVRWQWPASGKVIARFSTSGQLYKGVAIAGRIGEPVNATAGGKVVYSGAGLTGYGNLVIIRHNSSYLSAYAHNKTLLVSEGDTVKAGQKIAELGSTGTNEPKLHFEIRRDGKPVDPLLFLPNR
ncbi:peptidoglycan DD-metalloendopeptidase family protein [Parendozoicomonas sp. Alg238-R29]|uniref:peptidoglycan DD-metalloendopeptidase family protein n=1 Tax=Parendozoicomonas sp. Alg238-R29 TaxID=2993446 RepID=UPI00248E4B93|nr:peptidoglycan DD-metalloendopeptidase family protein [Parendozoicomonas sp. Alg238-R29]